MLVFETLFAAKNMRHHLEAVAGILQRPSLLLLLLVYVQVRDAQLLLQHLQVTVHLARVLVLLRCLRHHKLEIPVVSRLQQRHRGDRLSALPTLRL